MRLPGCRSAWKTPRTRIWSNTEPRTASAIRRARSGSSSSARSLLKGVPSARSCTIIWAVDSSGYTRGTRTIESVAAIAPLSISVLETSMR